MKKLILTFSLFFVLISCSDNLDRLPNDSLIAETAYQNYSDLQLGLNGVFGSYNHRNIITFNSIFTDECKIGADNGGQQVNLYNQVLDPQEGTSASIWTNHYTTINRANRIIEAAASITPSAADRAGYDNLLAQCYAIRALCHFDLLNHFTKDTYNLTSVAVPYVDFVNTGVNLQRNTVTEVRDGILDDLDTAEALLSNTNVYFVTADFLDFLRSKIYFVTGNFPLAISHADNVISSKPLANRSEYVDLFTDSSNAEVVFKRRRIQTENFIGGIWFFTGTGGAFMEMSNKVYNTLNPSDVRSDVLFNAVDSDPSINLHLINKYPGSSGFLYLNDEKVMRVSELYLIKAECQARLTLYVDAAATIKQIRDARFGTSTVQDVYSNFADAATAILAERFVELAYEGHRYVDVKRLRSAVNLGIVRDPADCGGASPCVLGVTDHRFTLPIPQSEMDTNGNMTQNDVY